MLLFTDVVLKCTKYCKESMKQLPEVMISLWKSQNPRSFNKNKLYSYILKKDNWKIKI